jgi:hypothetical protein
VKLRVFERHGGVCHISKRKITPADQWDCDHVLALINGGENRETNLAPALRDKHREKTAADVAIKSRAARRQAKHLGLKPKSRLTHPLSSAAWTAVWCPDELRQRSRDLGGGAPPGC